jgi:hypothetical protein
MGVTEVWNSWRLSKLWQAPIAGNEYKWLKGKEKLTNSIKFALWGEHLARRGHRIPGLV